MRMASRSTHRWGDDQIGRGVVDTQDVALGELLDRILDGGASIASDPAVSLTDVDFIVLGLKAMLALVRRTEIGRFG